MEKLKPHFIPVEHLNPELANGFKAMLYMTEFSVPTGKVERAEYRRKMAELYSDLQNYLKKNDLLHPLASEEHRKAVENPAYNTMVIRHNEREEDPIELAGIELHTRESLKELFKRHGGEIGLNFLELPKRRVQR